MVDAYNFFASWQLFPEKGTYEFGNRPRSGIYRIQLADNKQIRISMNWVSIEDQAFESDYLVEPDGEVHTFNNPEIGDTIQCSLVDSLNFETRFFKNNQLVLLVEHDITPKGFLKITQTYHRAEGLVLTNSEIYHKQMSVLPYSSSVSGALIKPNEAGRQKQKPSKATHSFACDKFRNW